AAPPGSPTAHDPRGLFVGADAVTRVIGLRERPATQTLTKDALSSHLADAADWYRLDKAGPVDTPLPRAVLDDLSGLPPEAWPLPTLERLTPAPVLAPDGTITTTPGYHRAARVYYAASRPLPLPPAPPATPTPRAGPRPRRPHHHHARLPPSRAGLLRPHPPAGPATGRRH